MECYVAIKNSETYLLTWKNTHDMPLNENQHKENHAPLCLTSRIIGDLLHYFSFSNYSLSACHVLGIALGSRDKG